MPISVLNISEYFFMSVNAQAVFIFGLFYLERKTKSMEQCKHSIIFLHITIYIAKMNLYEFLASISCPYSYQLYFLLEAISCNKGNYTYQRFYFIQYPKGKNCVSTDNPKSHVGQFFQKICKF